MTIPSTRRLTLRAATITVTILLSLSPCAPFVQAACIPVPVQDYGARTLSAHHLRQNHQTNRFEEDNWRIRDESALRAGDRQRITAAIAPVPAGQHLRQFLASIGADPAILGGMVQAGHPIQIASLSNTDPLLGSVLALIPDLLLSRLPPNLRSLAQAFLNHAGLLAANPERPLYTRTPTRTLLARRTWQPPRLSLPSGNTLPPGTFAVLHGRDAIRWLDHRERGLHHPNDRVQLPLNNGTMHTVPLASLYPLFDALGITDAYHMNQQPPLPWPPRPLTQQDRTVLSALSIQEPHSYGLPAQNHSPSRAAQTLLQAILSAGTTPAIPATGPVARALFRCRNQPGCNHEALLTRLAPTGVTSPNELSRRFTRPSREIHLALPGSRPPRATLPEPGPAIAALLGLSPSGDTPPWIPRQENTISLDPGQHSGTIRLSTSGNPTPVDHLYARQGTGPVEAGATARARETHLRHNMIDNLATALASLTRIRDIESASQDLPKRLASCESAVCVFRTLNDAYRVTADALALQARLENALLRQSLAERLVVSDPLPVHMNTDTLP